MTSKRTILAFSGVVPVVMLLLLSLQAQESGYVRRFAATRVELGGGEISSTTPPSPNGLGGVVIYNKNFFTANDINTIYVTISATGDSHFGARLQLSCLFDGQPCNPDAQFVGGAPTGWFTAQRHKNYNNNYAGAPFSGDGGGGAGDLHDNVVYYTWCTPFNGPAGTHNVQVRLAPAAAPGDPGSNVGPVFLEAVHFYIDGSRVANSNSSCPATTGPSAAIDPTVAVSPSTTIAPDGTLIDTTKFAPLTDPSILTVPPATETVPPTP